MKYGKRKFNLHVIAAACQKLPPKGINKHKQDLHDKCKGRAHSRMCHWRRDCLKMSGLQGMKQEKMGQRYEVHSKRTKLKLRDNLAVY